MTEKPDTKRVPHPDYRFWLYDPEGEGMTYYRTAEDRDKAAALAIDACRGDGDEGWYEDGLEGIAAGEVTHVARVTNKKMRPAELDDEQCDGEGTYWGDFEWMGNYTMVLLPNYVLTTRPHIGCATGRTIYEIRDARTRTIVRSQISPPSEQDCIDAVRNYRAPERVNAAIAVGGLQGNRRGKRAHLKL